LLLYPRLLSPLPRTLVFLHLKLMFEDRLSGHRRSLEVRRVQRLKEFPHAPRLLEDPPIQELYTLSMIGVLCLELGE
jgi:hypothetical protein